MSWVDATSASLPEGTVVTVTDGPTTAAVVRAEGGVWHAVDVWCTHAECPLTDGWVEGASIRCACHGALFELATGEPLDGPALEAVRVYATRVVEGRVEVELTDG